MYHHTIKLLIILINGMLTIANDIVLSRIKVPDDNIISFLIWVFIFYDGFCYTFIIIVYSNDRLQADGTYNIPSGEATIVIIIYRTIIHILMLIVAMCGADNYSYWVMGLILFITGVISIFFI